MIKEGDILCCKRDFHCKESGIVFKQGEEVVVENLEYLNDNDTENPTAYCVVDKEGEYTCIIIERFEDTIQGYSNHGEYFGRNFNRIRKIAKEFVK